MVIQFFVFVGIHRHSIQSGVWTRFHLNESGEGLNIMDALQKWYQNKDKGNVTFRFRDNCQGPHCNDACPELFILGELEHNTWNPSLNVFITLLVCGTAALCIILKIAFALWLCSLEWRQKQYLDQLGKESITYLETALQVHRWRKCVVAFV